MQATQPQPRQPLRELFVYATVGVVATGIQYGVLLGTVRGLGLRPVLGSTAGFVISAAANYLLNYHLTFRSHAPQMRAAGRFAFVALAGLVLNAVVMELLTEPLHLQYLLAQLTATAAVFAWSYLANSRWSFVSPQLETAGCVREECP